MSITSVSNGGLKINYKGNKNFLRKMSNAAKNILNGISSAIDEFVEEGKIEKEIYNESIKTDSKKKDRRNLEDSMVKNYEEGTTFAKPDMEEIDTVGSSPGEIIRLFPLFEKGDFAIPDRIRHMNFEAIEVRDDHLFIMPEIRIVDKTVINAETGKKTEYESNDPKVACKTRLNLDYQNSVVILSMRNCFDFISEILFELKHGLTKEESEGVLFAIVSKIMKNNDWTHSQALFSILIRDIIEPTVVLSSGVDSLHDTIRFFYTEKDVCRWAIVPYHSPSLNFGNFIMPGDDDFPTADLSDFKDF